MLTVNQEPESIDKAAEVMARLIHDQWGVGQQTACGGSGVLVFLSVHDRAVYISRGDALKNILTSGRLDSVIRNIKPDLQHGLYAQALAHAVWEIRAWTDQGEAGRWERLADFAMRYSGLLWISAIFGLVFWCIRKQQQRKREYAKVKSRLSELDRANAEALQGRFLAVSCPICLEAFQEGGYKDDDTPDSGRKCDETGQQMRGSDGLPLTLLRCGHVFDQSCWEEWTSSGRGDVTKCPICKTDVGKPTASAPVGSGEDQEASDAALHPYQNESAMQRYRDERLFRLQRLGHQYPLFIGPQQVQRWSQSSYNMPLATDRSFLERDPARLDQARSGMSTSSNSNSSQSGFGGGTSGGGRGGRW